VIGTAELVIATLLGAGCTALAMTLGYLFVRWVNGR
jgi:hypothetical protein